MKNKKVLPLKGRRIHSCTVAILGTQEGIPNSPGAPNSTGTFELCFGAALAKAATVVLQGKTAAHNFVRRLKNSGSKQTIVDQFSALGLDSTVAKSAILCNDRTSPAKRKEVFSPSRVSEFKIRPAA